jgi:hypothetical protein
MKKSIKRSSKKKSISTKKGGYSQKVTKLLLDAKNKQSKEAARLTKTTNIKCSPGKIKRRAYFRTDKNTKTKTAIGAKCIKNRGKYGKSKRTILLGPEDLGRYGYEDIRSLTKQERKKSLEDAVKAYGYVAVIRRVGAIASLLTRTEPELSKKFRDDQHMVSKWYNKAKEKGLPPTPR